MGHMVVAGTGRTGTSFLVRWLEEQGLDVGAFGPESWHEEARAGLERRLAGDDLPYVVKDPWLWTYVDEIDPTLIDVLVIPVRDLTAAATSRVNREVAAIKKAVPEWRTAAWGTVPGGVVYPISVESQAQILAVGFHVLVQWAVAHDVAMAFIDFARLNDTAYLRETLAPWLPAASTPPDL